MSDIASRKIAPNAVSPTYIGVIIAAAALAGTFLPWILAAMGVTMIGPGAAVATNARQIRANVERIDAIEAAVKETRSLFTGYVVSNCMDPAQAQRLREALVPCARLMDERGVLRP